MHWVDMEWLWGYNTLPSSARDMFAFCAAAVAAGHIEVSRAQNASTTDS